MLPAGADEASWKAWILAIEAGVLLLCVPAYLYVWRTPYEDFDWGGEFLNKRWLLALYWLGVGTFLVLPRVMATGAERRDESRRGTQECVRYKALKIVLAAGMAWYIAGPPWNLERYHTEIDGHEQVNLGPLQAIAKGYLPYVGPASSQYGPGSQLLTYGIMKGSGHFDLLSYRAAGAWFHLLTAFGICLSAMLFLEGRMVLPLVLLAMAYSPLGFFYFQPNGVLEGFYGWANGFRYMGAMIFLAGLPVVVRSRAIASLGQGAALGIFCWVSQENLSTTVFGAGLLLLLLWLTGTESAADLARCMARVACGFAAVWTPVLLFYAAHGQLSAFLRSYLLFGASVAHGVLNSHWLSGTDNPQYRSYLFTGVLLVVIGVFTIPLRTGLDRRQTRLLAFVCAAAAAYPVSLFRSDNWHTRNTTVALPFVMLLAVCDLPGWVAPAGWKRWTVRGLVAAVLLWVYPLVGEFATHLYAETVRLPLARFAAHSAPPPAQDDPRVPFQRATRYLSYEPRVSEGSVPMQTFLEEMSALREIVGTRRTNVVGFPYLYSGLILFMADLTPAPHYLAREMILAGMLEESLAYEKAHMGDYDCVITDDLEERETSAFREAYPAAKVVARSIGGEPYYIVLRP